MSKNSNKTLVVTGGLGFIGSHFIDLALQNDFSIINIDKVTYASFLPINPYFNKKYPGRYQFIKKDINDLKMLPPCDYIVHFAAESHVDNSIEDGSIFVKSNVLGTQHLLNLLVDMKKKNQPGDQTQLPVLIYIGTDEVFGDIGKGFFKETDQLNPSNPYSASKAAAELLITAYARTYGIPYKITRTTNNYGDRQHSEKLIPNCMLRVLRNEPIRIHGAGQQVRNWIHVKDNAQAILDVMLKGKINSVYHISSPEEYSINEVAAKILKIFNRPIDVTTIAYIPDRAGQDVRYALDCGKIRAELNWSPAIKFDEHLKQLAADYRIKYQKGKWPYVNF